MGLEPKFTRQDIEKRFNKFLLVVEKRQIERLQYLGELCATKAREIPKSIGFEDQTGNLRSSIGYMVFKDGVAVHEGYNQVGTGSEGVMAGAELAKKVGSKYKNGISLVVTAGMNYALFVEAKGRDVLSSSEMFARQELPKMLNELKRNITKALN